MNFLTFHSPFYYLNDQHPWGYKHQIGNLNYIKFSSRKRTNYLLFRRCCNFSSYLEYPSRPRPPYLLPAQQVPAFPVPVLFYYNSSLWRTSSLELSTVIMSYNILPAIHLSTLFVL